MLPTKKFIVPPQILKPGYGPDDRTASQLTGFVAHSTFGQTGNNVLLEN